MAYSRGTLTGRSEECAAVGRARLTSFPCRLERACANDLIYSLQGLELLVTVLLARNRQPPPTVAAGVPHADLAAELVSLPSGLLAMVCEAIVKLKVRHGGRLCVPAWGVRECSLPCENMEGGGSARFRGGPTVNS
jgi:hypothetical protein